MGKCNVALSCLWRWTYNVLARIVLPVLLSAIILSLSVSERCANNNWTYARGRRNRWDVTYGHNSCAPCHVNLPCAVKTMTPVSSKALVLYDDDDDDDGNADATIQLLFWSSQFKVSFPTNRIPSVRCHSTPSSWLDKKCEIRVCTCFLLSFQQGNAKLLFSIWFAFDDICLVLVFDTYMKNGKSNV